MDRIRQLLAGGAIGELREVQSTFHFRLRTRQNIRLDPELGGGALYDVGCYCIRLARLAFESDAVGGIADVHWAPEGVDDQIWGVLAFPGERRLVFSCGMERSPDWFSRLIGEDGEIRISHPFHPRPEHSLELRAAGTTSREHVGEEEPSFTRALRHIQTVLHGEEEPRHLAVDDAMGNARAIDLLYASARSGSRRTISS
jgi:predicted dehydrogenase